MPDHGLPVQPKEVLQAIAREMGLGLVGVTSAATFRRGERVALERTRRGLMGELPWYTEERIRRGARPRTLLPDARSVVSVAMDYLPEPLSGDGDAPLPSRHGRVARYGRRSGGRWSRGRGRRLPRRWGCSRLRAPKRTAAASGTAASPAPGPAALLRPRPGPSSGLRTLRPRPKATPWAPIGPPPALRPPAAGPSGEETTPSALHSRSPPPTSPS